MRKPQIEPGNHLLVRDAYGKALRVRAVTEVLTKGHSFPVVIVERPLTAGGVDRVPWPVDAVRMSVKEES